MHVFEEKILSLYFAYIIYMQKKRKIKREKKNNLLVESLEYMIDPM